MTDDPLTPAEVLALAAGGWVPDGSFTANGVLLLRFRHGATTSVMEVDEWRALIAGLPPGCAECAQLRAERDALGTAAKTLRRVQFILGGHSGIIADCDDQDVRENVERALSLMRVTLPLIKAALEDSKR